MEIDFDEASAAWRENKKHLGNGWFAYKCVYIHSNGKQCNKAVEDSKKPPAYRIREDWTCRTMTRYPEQYCWQHRNTRLKRGAAATACAVAGAGAGSH